MLAALAACSSPSPRYIGAPKVSLSVDGASIDVYSDGLDAQAIRLNYEWGFSSAKMERLGRRAIAEATGCRVDGRTVRADPSVMSARLICDDGDEARAVAPG